jgi:hypothetical protein
VFSVKKTQSLKESKDSMLVLMSKPTYGNVGIVWVFGLREQEGEGWFPPLFFFMLFSKLNILVKFVDLKIVNLLGFV